MAGRTDLLAHADAEHGRAVPRGDGGAGRVGGAAADRARAGHRDLVAARRVALHDHAVAGRARRAPRVPLERGQDVPARRAPVDDVRVCGWRVAALVDHVGSPADRVARGGVSAPARRRPTRSLPRPGPGRVHRWVAGGQPCGRAGDAAGRNPGPPPDAGQRHHRVGRRHDSDRRAYPSTGDAGRRGGTRACRGRSHRRGALLPPCRRRWVRFGVWGKGLDAAGRYPGPRLRSVPGRPVRAHDPRGPRRGGHQDRTAPGRRDAHDSQAVCRLPARQAFAGPRPQGSARR